MRKSSLPLIILLLVLGIVLCLCAATVAFAVLQVLRNVTEIDLPQIEEVVAPTTTAVLLLW